MADVGASSHSLAAYLRMLRPGFLVVTAVACLLGFASAAACGCGFSTARAAAALILALVVHAGANLLSAYHELLDGAAVANRAGSSPFAGGARTQNGVPALAEVRDLARVLLGLAVPGGVLLAAYAGGGLLLVGMAGLFLAWAYSAPPLALVTRGLGELAVGAAWWLIVIGGDYSQRGSFFIIPAVTAVSFALLVANLSLINGFPDASADGQVAKRTLAVRLGPACVSWLYLGVGLLAHSWLAVSVWLLIPPQRALAGLLSLPLSLAGAYLLWRHRLQPQRLGPAIALTIAAALVHGLAVAAGLLSVRWI